MQVCYSPQLRSVNKNSSSFSNSGAYTSPGTPDYGDNNDMSLEFQKGWYSERVPLPSNSSRRHISAAALMPFNSGRTLPSKWDDAERWITSPVSGFGVCNPPSQRLQKAKSGPLGGTHGYSPSVPVLDGSSSKNFLSGSPLTTGVLVPAGHTDYGNVSGWSELLIESSYQEDNHDEDGVSRVISRRDMATQMSPVCTPKTSPKRVPISPLYIPPSGAHHSARLEVKDVQVDKGVTITKQSKRHKMKMMNNNKSPEANNDLALTWNATQGAMKLSKIRKEEARITAWENLQNAKAEASIRKLEMKLEKKKSASMEKILNKHRAAQMKAQEMRRNISESEASENPLRFKTFRRYVRNCFRCHNL